METAHTSDMGVFNREYVDFSLLGEFRISDGAIVCVCPTGSVTTFFAK